jgi:4-amino-4-deoxy-L-arabinose transferase-like glycosyltransferase
VVILLVKIDNKSWKKPLSDVIHYLKMQRNSIIYIIILIIIVSLIAYNRILVQVKMGPVSDSVVFLANALTMAGHGTGYSNMLFPPFFSFVVSIFFNMGYIYSSTIFYIDGIFFVMGVIGLYLLLKIKFNDIESFLGALLYSTFPIILIVLGQGLSDLPSVSITIWAIYFLLLAVNRNSRFFYLALPLIMFAFLTRYNNALLIFPLILYLLVNRDNLSYKNIFGGCLAAFLVIVPVLIYFNEQFGNIFYPFLNFASSSSMISGAVRNSFYDPNIFFFLEKMPFLIGIPLFIILLFTILALFSYAIYKIIEGTRLNKPLSNALDLNEGLMKYKILLFFALTLIFLLSFGKIHYLLSEVLYLLTALIFYKIVKNLNIKDLRLHFLFFSWFMTFFIFHSIFVLKDVRYFVVMTPPLSYFIILGLSEISKLFNIKFRETNLTFLLLAIMLSIMAVSSAASQIPMILQDNQDNVVFNQEIASAGNWIMVNDPNYRNKNIYSDLWPNFSWYLKTNVKPVPVFKGNDSFLVGVIDFSFNQADSDKFNNYLVTHDADYYLSVRQGLNLTSYMEINHFGNLIIYKRKF